MSSGQKDVGVLPTLKLTIYRQVNCAAEKFSGSEFQKKTLGLNTARTKPNAKKPRAERPMAKQEGAWQFARQPKVVAFNATW